MRHALIFNYTNTFRGTQTLKLLLLTRLLFVGHVNYLCFSTFQHNTSSDTENSDRQSRGVDCSAILADTVLVPSVNEIMHSTAHKDKSEQIVADFETQTQRNTPSLPEIDTSGMPCIRETLEEQNLSLRTI